MSPRALGVAVAALAVLLWAIGALDPVQHGYWSGHDLRRYFFPVYAAFYGALRGGSPMLWNPYQLCGVPLVATLQGGFFYPPHVLYLLLPTGWAIATSTALHFGILAGTGAAFARRVGLSVPAAILATAVLALSGPIRQLQLWPYFFEASTWLPLGAIGILDLSAGRRARGGVFIAVATGATCLAGSPQSMVFAAYAWAALLTARLFARRLGPHECTATVSIAVGALVMGGMLGAVALLPAYETAKAGARSAGTLSAEHLYPMWGIPSITDVVKSWLVTGTPLLAVSFTLIPFAVLGARWLSSWAFVVGGLAILLALGPATPAFRLYFLLPGLAWFRFPYRLLTIAAFALGVLAGMGLDQVVGVLRTRLAAAALVAMLLAVLVHEGLTLSSPAAPPLPYRRRDVPWTGAQHDGYVRLAEMAGSDRVWPYSPGVFANSLPPKLPMLTGIRSIEDYEPLILRRQAEFFTYFLEGSTTYSQPNTAFEGRLTTLAAPPGREPPATRRRLLDLAATRFVVMPSVLYLQPAVQAFVRDAGLRAHPAPALDFTLFENPHALPRAYVTYRARRAPDTGELLARMAREDFDPLVESFFEADADLQPPAGVSPRGTAATIVRDDSQIVEVQATLSVAGLVVLSDTFAPGWEASVDGVDAPILPTNHLFRGVPAPAGTHRVRFEYRPQSLRIGAALTLASALGLLVFAWRVRW